MPASRLRAAIIGCGVIAPVHVRALALDGHADLVVACDLDLERARRQGAARTTDDWRAVVAADDVDAVIVATPHHLHADVACAALAAGKHVICEKPLATTPADVERMLDAACHAGDRQAVGIFQHRCNPLLRRLRELVRGGAFGRIVSAGLHFRCTRTAGYYASAPWRGRWASEGGGLLINQAIHGIDQLLQLSGDAVAVRGRVALTRLRGVIEVEDRAQAELELEHGAIATIDAANDGEHDWRIRLDVRGERGAFTIGDDQALIALDHPSRILRQELAVLDAQRNAVVDVREGTGAAKACYGGHHLLQLADAFDAIRAGRPPLADFAACANTVHAVLGIYRSTALNGARVALPVAAAYAPPAL